MKVLLINPNRYMYPPVPPIGLEHIAASLERAGHQIQLLDLCFSQDPSSDIDSMVVLFDPDIAGITVRNADTVLYQTNEFFLDDIKTLIAQLKYRHGLKVVIGGAGVSINPEGVRDYLNADCAVSGPAEDIADQVFSSVFQNGPAESIFRRAYCYEIACRRKSHEIDYRRYFDAGGTAGFITHTGCGSSCIYCIEADSPVSWRPISEVLAEIRGFVDRGYRRFHLCDAEFNEDLDYCIAFCTVLKQNGLEIDWAVYMKPANYNKKLFRLMKDTGVSLITLSVDSWKKCPLYWSDIEKIVFIARSCGIRLVIDFLTGFPGEDEETLKWYLDMFRRIGTESVGINTYIRLYRTLPVTRLVMSEDRFRSRCLGALDDPSFIRPVFYNHIVNERLRELIGSDSLFRIERERRGVNYSEFP